MVVAMRARMLVGLFFVIGIISFGIPAHAAVPDPFIYYSRLIGMPPLPNAPYGTLQTAVRTGDTPTLQVYVHDIYSGVPSISANLSDLGLSDSATTSGAWVGYGAQYYPAYYYSFGPLSVDSAVVNGLHTIPIMATDVMGNVATATTSIIVDNIPPVISLTNITFSSSTTSPQQGDYMYLSGSMDGTGTKIVSGSIMETLLGADKNERGPWPWHRASYDQQTLITSAASSVDGVFTKVPFLLNEGGVSGDIATSSFFKIDISVYDEAGNFATTSLTVPVPRPDPADPCVATNTCASNVFFLPGIEGSRLYENMPCASGVCETKLWEPSGDTLALRLAHNLDGTSANADIYEKKNGIIDNAYIPVKGNIYKSFTEQMNGLVSAKTIKEWEAIPYDWRLTPEQILASGAQIAPNKISYLVATSSPFIIQELRRLASSSKTGKVTIIAHSNGGLVTKALIEKLGPEATDLVDKIILVAVPQAGTPQAIGALLHGYGQGLPVELFPYALSDGAARTLATNMPMTYNLLPSSAYFTQVDTPVVTFTNQSFLASFRNRYGDIIHSRERLHSFLVDPWRLASSTTEGLNYPSVGNESLLAQAEMLHADLDSWIPPPGITLYEIAGWGEKTLAGIDYYQGVAIHCDQIVSVLSGCTRMPKIDYHPRIVLDGDGTVVTPSALWMSGANRYWVNLRDYNGFFGMTNHGNILEIPELRTFIQDLLTNSASTTFPQYISIAAPTNQNTGTELHFTLHSPLTLNLYDDQGRHTGISTTTGELEEDIPESRYMKFGEVQFISAPSLIHTQLIMNGSAVGSFTLDAEEARGDAIVASTTFSGIPSAATAVVKMDIPSGGLANMGALTVDESGNGHSDITLQPKAGNTVLFDITPPEIQVTFSTTTKAIVFSGTDDNGTVTMSTSDNYSTFKENQKEKNGNRGIATTIMTARDGTGNTTVLTYTKLSSDSDERHDAIGLASVSYNGVQSDLSKTTLRYEWGTNKKGRYTMFAAYLKTASSTIDAQYQPKKNLTVITTRSQKFADREDGDETGPRSIQSKLPGLVIPRIQTENGSAKIIY